MTGNVIMRDHDKPDIPHTHAIFEVKRGRKVTGYLHYTDPRRFGWITCCSTDDRDSHPFFVKLGPEPLDCDDLDQYLWERARKKTVAIKNFLMDAHVVVGVGNIYASESLFRAGVRPTRPASRVTRKEMAAIAESIKKTLRDAIRQGGTSFRDFKNADGNPGYFTVSLNVYGKEGDLCNVCGSLIKQIRQGGGQAFTVRLAKNKPFESSK